MPNTYLQIGKIAFSGPTKEAELKFEAGVNVVCGASDTGKSFLAESIDFMLGGNFLREIPQRDEYEKLTLSVETDDSALWRFERSITGGAFNMFIPREEKLPTKLKQKHAHGKTDNLSGLFLEKIGLLGKRVLRNKQGATNTLSLRNLARLTIVQETEIQQKGSPFWSGQWITKTPDIATLKLLLTGLDDSAVVAEDSAEPDVSKQIDLIDEFLSEISDEISGLSDEEEELTSQLSKLQQFIESQREILESSQEELNSHLSNRKKAFTKQQEIQDRQTEIEGLLARFQLLSEHYAVDLERLTAIQESGSVFTTYAQKNCPLCGASAQQPHSDEDCDGNIDSVILAATAEITKIKKLIEELNETTSELEEESRSLAKEQAHIESEYSEIDLKIKELFSPQFQENQTSFAELVDKRSIIQHGLGLYQRQSKLQERRSALLDENNDGNEDHKIVTGLSKAKAHAFSLKISKILKAWDFPGNCDVHFDQTTSDFVIDGKARGDSGKGLRAITHAAATIGLLEFCQENDLPHLGFVVLDSPLLAYYKPEEDDEASLKGSNLKEKFYEYLISHHSHNSQIIIIENQHPPEKFESNLHMTVFTGNANSGRFGFL